MIDWFTIILAAIVLAIVGFIVYSVRRTMAQIGKSGVSGEEARDLAKKIRERDVRCPRCNGQAFALLGKENQWKCDLCNHEFEGPDHIPLP